ncbi:hypothetical protein RFI_25456, partial [Reticulomyxa filosa]
KKNKKNSADKNNEQDNTKTMDVLRTLWKMFRGSLLRGAAFYIFQTFSTIGSVFAFSGLVGYFYATHGSTRNIWIELLLAFCIPFCYFIRFICLARMFVISEKLGVQVRSLLMALIFRKALKIPNHVRQSLSTGEIVNVMSADTERVTNACKYLITFTVSPIAILIGVVFMLKANDKTTKTNKIKKKGRKLQQNSHKAFAKADARVKFLTEMLNGVRVLKMSAWEKPLAQVLNQLRSQELSFFKSMFGFRAVIMGTVSTAYLLTIVVTLLVNVLAGHPLTVRRLYVTYQFILAIRFSLNLIPISMSVVLEGWVALGRIQQYMDRPDHVCLVQWEEQSDNGSNEINGDADDLSKQHGNDNNDDNDNDIVIDMNNASFQHSPFSKQNMLKQVYLQIKKGELVGVIGSVGSGKSTLLSSLLGLFVLIESDFNPNSF